MTRNKYSKKFQKEMEDLHLKKTLNELLNIARNKYNYNISKSQLRQYLSKRKLRYKDYAKRKVREMSKYIPIGTEYLKNDGMTLIKIAKDKWVYKQRYIYEKYYNLKLTSDDYIIFLDHNRNNFNIKNLKRINRHESSIIGNQKLFSKNAKLTETGILLAKLIIKLKEMR